MSKKDKIVQAAIEVFKEKGIERTKVSDIVKAAGIAQGTYYLYFPSKLAIMPAIADVLIEILVADIRKQINTEDPFKTQLDDLVEVMYQHTKEYRDVHSLVYAGLSSTEYLQQWEEIYEPFYEWLGDVLENAIRREEVRQEMNAKRTAKLLIGTIETSAEQAYLYDQTDEKEIDEQKKELRTFINQALGTKND
ncbi:TetR family transcriptional regulator [Geomicrobium sp. JCM 19038]|uniref:TetR family transcriptional regulator n=1 Tax=Geomicrobium sp. JCM 19038 TaxID=1460635 RepID=UPI00045F2B63|nr:TetR family transcriptional regulator [Geomicrobium sp. JCM 19038]GAK08556.1 transcriptional regulator, TetR family [Geomicrobium sp. JCM 19038]